MGRISVLLRLAKGDARRRPVELLLLLLAVAAATTTLTIGLVLHGETAAPYARTRAATTGPDVVVNVFPPIGGTVSTHQLAQVAAIVHSPAVAVRGPAYPVTWADLRVKRLTATAELQGRDRATSAVDRPTVLSGGWIRSGGAVIEHSFARALGVHVGDRVRIGTRTFRVVGIAVTAAFPSYPQLCTVGCILSAPGMATSDPGLVWVTRGDAEAAATSAEPLTYFRYLRLRDPSTAPRFVDQHSGPSSITAPTLTSWQDLDRRAAELVRNERTVVLLGSWLLGILAIATVVVVVGGRMAEETRRVGALKAVGATPGFITAIVLGEYLAIALAAAALGLVVGRLVAPLLTPADAGLLGDQGQPALTAADVGLVMAAAVGITLLATVVPATRAARFSTVRALADSVRVARRPRLLNAISARLPAPLLVGLRIASRRPRRAVLNAVSIGIAVCGIVVILYAHANIDVHTASSTGLPDPNVQRLNQVMVALTALLTVMASVILVFVGNATAADAQRAMAVTRALGASPNDAAAGLAVAQVIPAMGGVILGLPTGVALFAALSAHGQSVAPPWWSWLLIAGGTVLLAIALTSVPARVASRRSISNALRSELA